MVWNHAESFWMWIYQDNIEKGEQLWQIPHGATAGLTWVGKRTSVRLVQNSDLDERRRNEPYSLENENIKESQLFMAKVSSNAGQAIPGSRVHLLPIARGEEAQRKISALRGWVFVWWHANMTGWRSREVWRLSHPGRVTTEGLSR